MKKSILLLFTIAMEIQITSVAISATAEISPIQPIHAQRFSHFENKKEITICFNLTADELAGICLKNSGLTSLKIRLYVTNLLVISEPLLEFIATHCPHLNFINVDNDFLDLREIRLPTDHYQKSIAVS